MITPIIIHSKPNKNINKIKIKFYYYDCKVPSWVLMRGERETEED